MCARIQDSDFPLGMCIFALLFVISPRDVQSCAEMLCARIQDSGFAPVMQVTRAEVEIMSGEEPPPPGMAMQISAPDSESCAEKVCPQIQDSGFGDLCCLIGFRRLVGSDF